MPQLNKVFNGDAFIEYSVPFVIGGNTACVIARLDGFPVAFAAAGGYTESITDIAVFDNFAEDKPERIQIVPCHA